VIDPMVWRLSAAHPNLRPQWLRDRLVPAIITTRRRGLVDLIKATERAINKPKPPAKILTIKKIEAEQKSQKENCKRIAEFVAGYYGISKNAFYSQRREARIVRARQVAYHIAKEMTCASFPEIGRNFGGRDHSTILHGCRKIETLLQQDDRQLAADIAYIIRALAPTEDAVAA
jgi:chromosomal replication initiation ATPase DnaA